MPTLVFTNFCLALHEEFLRIMALGSRLLPSRSRPARPRPSRWHDRRPTGRWPPVVSYCADSSDSARLDRLCPGPPPHGCDETQSTVCAEFLFLLCNRRGAKYCNSGGEMQTQMPRTMTWFIQRRLILFILRLTLLAFAGESCFFF